MNKYIIIVVCLYIILAPFYIFPSGMPQPADIIFAIGIVPVLLSKGFYKVFNQSITKKFLRLLILIIIVNSSYWFYLFAISGIRNSLLFFNLFYIFNFLFAFLFLYMFLGKDRQKINNIIALVVLFSISLQFILGLLGITNGNSETGTRNPVFFNNPNQLGYFAVSMITLYCILKSKYRDNKLILIYAFFITIYLVLLSGSRAALGSIILLFFYMLYKVGFKLSFTSILLLLMVFITVPYALSTDFVGKRLNLIENRTERNINSRSSEAEIRGYDRIYKNPEYLLTGAGEGKYDRFESRHHLELHSGFGTMLFSYGILGFILFLNILYSVIKKDTLNGLAILFPLFFYNLTHNGLRNSIFWAVIIIFYYVNQNMFTES